MVAKSSTLRYMMVVFTSVAVDAPAAVRMALRLLRASRVCASIPSGISPVAGSIPAVPEQKTKPPATMAWLYGPIAAGASSVETARRSTGYLVPLGRAGQAANWKITLWMSPWRLAGWLTDPGAANWKTML